MEIQVDILSLSVWHAGSSDTMFNATVISFYVEPAYYTRPAFVLSPLIRMDILVAITLGSTGALGYCGHLPVCQLSAASRTPGSTYCPQLPGPYCTHGHRHTHHLCKATAAGPLALAPPLPTTTVGYGFLVMHGGQQGHCSTAS